MPIDNYDFRHLARIVDSSDDAIISKDLDGIIQSWNKAAERIFGYTAEEAIGQSIRILIPDDLEQEENYVLTQIRSGQAIQHYETTRRHRDGHLIPMSLTVSPILDADERVIGASTIARDISDRRAADVIARRLAAIVEWSDDAIVTKNLDSTITSWNRGAERMFGYAASEVLGKSVRILIPPDLQSEEDTVLERLRGHQVVDHFQTRRLRKDGSEIIVSLTVSPILNDRGEVIGASKIARDITEHVKLRERASEQAEITRQLAEVGQVISSSLDHRNVVQRVVERAREMTGASFATFDPLFQREKILRFDDVTADPRDSHHIPLHAMPEETGPIRSFLAIPVTSGSGTVLGGLIFGHPETGHFTSKHEQLATGIATWASIGLENARLYGEAREADRLKDEFLAVFSHELRTPLNAIVGYARLLRSGMLSGERAARGIETVERNAGALSQIIEDVLDISRIVSGKIRLDVQPVELPLVIHNSIATVQPAADARQIRLESIVDAKAGPVSGDPNRLQQVVWNLLSNAVKFTPKGGRVQVRLERVNSHVEIVVSDTGVGISPDFLPHVFERFRQADVGPMRKSGGLGLGLSIARHIVEMHGGSISVESEGEGTGATFRVRLPLMIVHRRESREPREHPTATTMEPLTKLGGLDGVRVLAVDDEEDALELLRTVLEMSGAEAIAMTSAEQALNAVAGLKPHVLIVDLGMPGMDGFGFISRLRAHADPEVAELPAVALTAFARPEDRTRVLQSGFEMHLAKPVDPGELAASISTLVRRRRPRGG